MGLEIFEEFGPITPIKTVATTVPRTTFNHHSKESLDLDTSTKEVKVEEDKEEEEEECYTPTSPSQTLKTPLVCPPPPKKQRVAVARRSSSSNYNVIAPSQMFFQVPRDLASVFLLHHHKSNIKKISLFATSYS
ncbi:hypothetical protein RIF29_07327 [Crotalaria pallida]|uniref:Uncharacterized protein n=1 Tax=Crotalaria pallida TaxID=3830 RepID=A0AAN9J491_CROPI